SLENLQPGNYRLALLDVATGRIEPLPGFADGKHIDPQWGPDAKSLYFVSDRNGIANVYRLDVGSGALFQVTNLYTGPSGITLPSRTSRWARTASAPSWAAAPASTGATCWGTATS